MKSGGWIFTAIATAGLLLTLHGASYGVPPTSIRFNHKLHTGEDIGLDCSTCHTAAKSTSSSQRLLPTMETCGQCHDVDDETQCKMCHTDVDNAGPIDAPPREVHFSHKKHLGMAGVACRTCHAGVEKSETTKGNYLPTMATCTTCHNQVKAPVECSACHIKVADLKPKSHRDDWVREHGRRVRAGDVTCAPCHSQSDCQECHSGARITAKIPPLSTGVSFAPQSRGSAGLILQGAHSLNYRFTHALDAQGKERECAVCHETSTFCTKCHSDVRSDAKLMVPAWHGGPDWGAIAGGVGTGGGRHAEMARRDIEQCAACHDIQGDDPVCMLCHMDRNPGLGNDPKTHGPGFAARVGYGDFHNNPNSMCFNCHTYKGPAGGPGFCGYCHGAK